jgi:tetratricopeptide (TPR) repeat protein
MRYRKAAEQGEINAQYNLGTMYYIGQGVPKGYAEAFKWYHQAAEQGLAEAQFDLGNMYSKGEGVPQAYAEAAKWFRKAAELSPIRTSCPFGRLLNEVLPHIRSPKAS